MTDFTIASFNVKNLIGPDQEYYKFQNYTPEEYAWKSDWMADQMLTLDADVVGFQEIFDEVPLREIIAETDRRGMEANAASLPDVSKRYHRKAIFRKLAYTPYTGAELVFAPNVNDSDMPGKRRPGLAILSRYGFAEPVEVIQDLAQPVDIPMACLGGDDDAGYYTLRRLSRPIMKARIPVGDQLITVFNCHLKSKLGEFITPQGAPYAPESVLTAYDASGRALGALRAALRRMAEAWVLRRAVLDELEQGRPVMVLGDFNDGEHAVSSEIISGETPFRNYAWMLRHDASHSGDRYSAKEDAQIRDTIDRLRLRAAEKMFLKKSLRDVVYTTAFGGVHESIDQIYMSRHFDPDWSGSIGEMQYFSVFNDHLTDGSHPEAPYNKLASDHGQIMAHMHLYGGK
ncbi:endonuclease/exonuclease/phosphatase family protein [Phaeobacter porticola]|uniref:Endonuclease/exonuclease/phosphatase domain-containing protein n=1 Tax=Phaeobacter porticola TaxID=1844006 RepID=A0A1L3I8C7_9RHOB|nr:endonuclease/exonuclease/phosphatase family protein [Phaeobacter porticola]APG48272.1 endonuclease/exonuclease/phosphatase domain-containing protein [Phaeobacter porticola]